MKEARGFLPRVLSIYIIVHLLSHYVGVLENNYIETAIYKHKICM